MKRLVTFFVTFSLVILSPFALADSVNPPRVLGIKIANEKATYAPGDEIIYEIEYTGGNPGIKKVELQTRPTKDGVCIGLSGYLFWEEGKKYSNANVGPINDRIIRLIGTISSDCANGTNTFNVSWLVLVDKTDLAFTGFVYLPSINIRDGKYIPPGTLLGTPKKSVIDLQVLQDSYVVDESKPTLVLLPRMNSDGILIQYRATGLPICDFLRDSSVYGYQLSLEKKGMCLVEASVKLTRSEFSDTYQTKRIELASEAEVEAKTKAAADLKAKQEADAKTAAELKAKQEAEAKAAAELKAKQEAEAKAAALAAANKKTTITCIKGKLTKKVTAVKPTCPSGYKVKK